jgi:hypothetical protein
MYTLHYCGARRGNHPGYNVRLNFQHGRLTYPRLVNIKIGIEPTPTTYQSVLFLRRSSYRTAAGQFFFHDAFSDRLPPFHQICANGQIAAPRNNSTVRRRVSTGKIESKFFLLRYEFHLWKKVLSNVISDRKRHLRVSRTGRVQITVRQGSSCSSFCQFVVGGFMVAATTRA